MNFEGMSKREIIAEQDAMLFSDPEYYKHHCYICGESLGYIDEDENGICQECEEENET